MDPTFWNQIGPLVGVIVGGLIGYLTSLLVSRRQEKLAHLQMMRDYYAEWFSLLFHLHMIQKQATKWKDEPKTAEAKAHAWKLIEGAEVITGKLMMFEARFRFCEKDKNLLNDIINISEDLANGVSSLEVNKLSSKVAKKYGFTLPDSVT